LVNDGSNDSTAEICKNKIKQDSRIRLIESKNNLGVAAARNIGLDAVQGEFISFVDSDDFITKWYYELLMRISSEQNCEMVQCKMKWGCTVDSTDDFDIDSHYFMTVHRDRADASKSLQDGRDSRMGGMVCAKLYSKRLFEDLRFPPGKIHEDEALMHHLVYRAKGIACISAMMYYYVKNEQSIVNKPFSKQRYDVIDQLEARYQFYLEKGLTDCAYMTAQRLGSQLIELYRNTKEHLGEENQTLLKIYADILPRYIDSPFMTETKKQLHLLWLEHPEQGECYFSIGYMRDEFYKEPEWV